MTSAYFIDGLDLAGATFPVRNIFVSPLQGWVILRIESWGKDIRRVSGVQRLPRYREVANKVLRKKVGVLVSEKGLLNFREKLQRDGHWP